MTSDGITDSDWDFVKEISAKIADSQFRGDEATSEVCAMQLLNYLATIERKYGPLPSILATRADYVEDVKERVRLLKEAWVLAGERYDWANRVFISSSLAALYIEELADRASGKTWLALLNESLEKHWDEDEHGEMLRLNASLDEDGG